VFAEESFAVGSFESSFESILRNKLLCG